MTRHRSHQASARGRYVPRLEALEERSLPAVNFFVIGTNLLVFGPTTSHTPGPEHVVLVDNGTGSANNITAIGRQRFFPNVPITNVFVFLHGGHNSVSYNLTGDLTVPRTVTVGLNGGHGHFDAVLRRNLLAGSSLLLNVGGSGPNDRIQTEVIGSVVGGASLQMNYTEQVGNNSIAVTSATSVSVGVGSLIQMDLFSGFGSGNIVADYQGQMNGRLGVFAQGGNGPDHIVADIEMAAGSTGTVIPSEVLGGLSNDFLTFIIHNPGTAHANNLILDGNAGFNTAFRTTNVDAFNIQRDIVVP
jgi:hypothetical protein